jgi:hypothetical protein
VNLPYQTTMAFSRLPFSQSLVSQLALSEDVGTSLAKTGQDLICDINEMSALVPHAFHHSTFPDQSFSFFVKGEFFSVWEVRGADGPNRVEVRIDTAAKSDGGQAVADLLAEAMAFLRNEHRCSIPIVVKPKHPPAPASMSPRPPAVLIERLNTLCEEAGMVLDFPEMYGMAVQTVIHTVLRPTEAAALRHHLESEGWGALSPKARELVQKVLDQEQAGGSASSEA